jgi:hypothetical protein
LLPTEIGSEQWSTELNAYREKVTNSAVPTLHTPFTRPGGSIAPNRWSGQGLVAGAFVAAGALVAALLVSPPAVPALGSGVPPVPPLHPAISSATAAPIAHTSVLTRPCFSFTSFIHLVLSLWFGFGGPPSPAFGSPRTNLAGRMPDEIPSEPDGFYNSPCPVSVDFYPGRLTNTRRRLPRLGGGSDPACYYSAACCCRAFLLSSMTLDSASRGISS